MRPATGKDYHERIVPTLVFIQQHLDDDLALDEPVTVNRPVYPEGEFGLQELPGGKYALMKHRGPYAGLGAAYQHLYGGWLPKSGYQLREAPAFDEYWNSPQSPWQGGWVPPADKALLDYERQHGQSRVTGECEARRSAHADPLAAGVRGRAGWSGWRRAGRRENGI